MAVQRSFRIIDFLMRRVLRVRPATEMTQDEIELARRPFHEAVGERGKYAERVMSRLIGKRAPGVVTAEIEVPGADGPRPARVHRPDASGDGSRPIVLHLHGGGFAVGGPAQYDPFTTFLAAELDAIVVSVDYRKAPEQPAPASVDDAIAAARWLAEGGAVELGGDPARLVVGGDSAGGNLSALVAIALRDTGLALAAQVLIYPATDLTMSTDSVRELRSEPILSGESMDAFLELYLADGVAPDDPHVSPAFANDLSGLAPALVITAEHDPLRDEGIAYAGAMRAAGVAVRLTNYLGMPHGFVSLPGASLSSRQAWSEIASFSAEVLAAEPAVPAL